MEKLMPPILQINKLHVSIENKEILKGVDLVINEGESHVIMGPNGSGKSTLSYAVLGHPRYKIDSGDILLNGESILDWPTEKRARHGIFLSFQHPTAIPGVTVNNFLRSALKSSQEKELPIREFRKKLLNALDSLGMDSKFAGRYINDGFSGGEKKRAEILQLALLQPRLAILDEIDSGLDIDGLRLIADRIEGDSDSKRSFLLITHYQRLIEYLNIDRVHIFINGRIVKSGDKSLSERLEKDGYNWVEKELCV